jgi:8-hydroxy-5-deazaflavin:NADPH oxidoreductase
MPERTTVVTIGNSLIGIVGAGAIGRAVARHAARSGIDVVMSDWRDPEAFADFVAVTGPRIRAGTLAEAAEPEVVVLATPWPDVVGVLTAVAEWEGRILVDATNLIAPRAEAPEHSGATSSEAVERLAPGAHLIKAFNTLPAELLAANPLTVGGRRVLFLAGNHARSKAIVKRMIEAMGFAAIDIGTLAVGGALMDAADGPLFGENLVRPGP